MITVAEFIYYLLVMAVVYTSLKVLILFSHKFKLIDFPNDRKHHGENIPLIGGIAMFIGFIVGYFLLFSPVGEDDLYFLLCCSIVLIIGVIDDLHDISVKTRLFAQIIVAFIITLSSEVVLLSLGDLIGVGEIRLTREITILLTVLAIVGGMNSFNIIDGINGLAGGIAIVTFSSILYLAYKLGVVQIISLSLLYIIVLLPFMLFNLIYNKLFMGDAGALFLGLGITWLLIDNSQGDMYIFRPITALWLYAIPLIDIISVMIMRIKSNRSLFMADKNHIHHLLMKVGLSDRETFIVIVGISIVLATIGVVAEQNKVEEWIMFFCFLLMFALYFVFYLKLYSKYSKKNKCCNDY